MKSELQQFVAEVPLDLEGHFERIGAMAMARRRDTLAGLLLLEESTDLTRTYHAYFPVLRELGGIVLDDDRSEGHHVYLTHPSLAGYVLYFAHDDNTRAVFASLAEYLMAIDAAAEQHRPMRDFHPVVSPLAVNQVALKALISSQLDGGSRSAIICAVLPSLDLRDQHLLRRLAQSSNFYLAEALAAEIRKRPRLALRDVAEFCAGHPFSSVATAGLLALDAIRELGPGSGTRALH